MVTIIFVFVFEFVLVKKTSFIPAGSTFEGHFLVVGPEKLLKGPVCLTFKHVFGTKLVTN